MVKRCYDEKYDFELLDPKEREKIDWGDLKKIR